jgi:TRAP-type C4-dicarboxylate transport system substrate-binding protein
MEVVMSLSSSGYLSRRRWKVTIAFATSLLLLLGVSACRKGEDKETAEVIKLKYSSPYMHTEPPNIQAMHALELVAQKTGGRVQFETFMGGALGGPLEQLDLVASGAVDVIHLHVDQFPQQLPLHKILNNEQFTTADKALANVTAVTQEIPETKAILDAEQQQNNIKILSWHVQGATGITAGFPARSLADLKGKKMNFITSFQRKVLSEFDINPINVQIPDLYDSLSRGVIDSIFMATAAVVPNKWYEVGKTYLVFGDNFAISQPITLNRDTWNSLPADIQQAFVEASRETALWSIEEDQRNLQNTYDTLKQAGVEIVELPPEESQAFFESLARHANEDWLENAENRGVGDKAAVIEKYWNEMKWGKWANQ